MEEYTHEISLNNFSMDDGLGGIEDNFLTLCDENASVVVKGILDTNGSFYIDPSQFTNLFLDHPTTGSSIDAGNGMTIQMIAMPTPQGLPTYFTKSSTTSASSNIENVSKHSSNSSSHNFPLQQNFSSGSYSNTINILPVNSQFARLQVPNENLDNSTGILGSGSSNSQTEASEQNAKTRLKPMHVKIHSAPNEIDPPIGKGPFRCNICSKEFPKWPQLKRHKAEHLDEKPFRCKLCPMSFNFEENCKLHLMVHEAESSGNLHCQVCPSKFSRLASLKSHLRIHEKDENLVCQECGDEFPTNARLETHIEEHNTRVQQCMLYRCRMCGKSFTQAALLKDHSKQHAAVRKELKNFGSRQKRKAKPIKAVNPQSESENSNRSKLKKNKKICSQCGKAFDKPSQLERHVRIHTGEKPFACNQCGKKFNQKGTLEAHVLATHLLQKPHKCHLCSSGFSQRGNLKAHILKVHVPPGDDEKVFKCMECSCVYRRLATLNNHMAKVHAVTKSASEVMTSVTTQATATSKNVFPHPAPTQKLKTVISVSSQPRPLVRRDVSEEINPQTQMPHRDQTNEQNLIKHSANFNNSSSSNLQENCNTVQEVNCVYGDSAGASKRCLVKVKRVGQVKWHLCPYCPKSFRKPSDLIRHIRTHTLERPYSCNICHKSFAVKSTLNTHLKIHNPYKELACNVCHKRFSVLSSLKSHERLHTGAKPFQCMQCLKQFRTSGQRRVHMRTHVRNSQGLTGKRKLLRIGNTKGTVDLPDPLKITSDGLVPVPNRAIKSLVSGALVDQRARPYKCRLCPGSFKKTSHLKQHIRSHTGEKPYKCLKCNRSFVSNGVLKNHINTHEGVRKYTCKLCLLSFTTNGSLTRHLSIHSDSRPFVCPYCHKTFKTSVSCRKHIKIHRNEIIAFNSSGVEKISDDLLDNLVRNSGLENHNNTSLIQQTSSFGPTCVDEFEEDLNDVTQVLSREMSIQSINHQQVMSGIPQHISVDHTSQVSNGTVTVPLQQSVTENNDGTITLQYTVGHQQQNISKSSIPENDMPMRLDTNESTFDPSLFNIQGESMEYQFLRETQQLQQHISELTPLQYEYCGSNNERSKIETNNHLEQYPPEPEATHMLGLDGLVLEEHSPVKSLPGPAPAVSKKIKSKESVEILRIREESRPISEQIYTELTTLPYVRRPKENLGIHYTPTPDRTNVCPLCSRSFKKRSDLVRHHRIHTGEKPFKCNVCGKAFRVKSTREAHMRTHVGGKTVSCHVCNNLFSTKSSLRVHMRLHTGTKPYKCSHCDKCFRTSGHRKAHSYSHFKTMKEPSHLSSNPPTSTLTKPETSSQIRRGHSEILRSERTRLMNSLPNIQDNEMSLKQNNELDLSSNAVSTNNLGPGVQIPDNLHVIGSVQVALDGSTIQLTGLDIGGFQVDDNFLRSVTNIIYLPPSDQNNINSGSGNNPNNMVFGVLPDVNSACDVLTGKDVTLSHLNLLNGTSNQINEQHHQNSSMNVSTRTISDSGSGLEDYIGPDNRNNGNGLVVHMKNQIPLPRSSSISTTTGPPEDRHCTICQKTFQNPSQFQRHALIHTGEKPFQCTICQRSFAQKSSLDSHMYVHSNERPFSCPHCPFTAVKKSSLKTHFNRAHPDTWTEYSEQQITNKASTSSASSHKVEVSA